MEALQAEPQFLQVKGNCIPNAHGPTVSLAFGSCKGYGSVVQPSEVLKDLDISVLLQSFDLGLKFGKGLINGTHPHTFFQKCGHTIGFI